MYYFYVMLDRVARYGGLCLVTLFIMFSPYIIGSYLADFLGLSMK